MVRYNECSDERRINMKIALAAFKFINNDVEYNVSQIEKALKTLQHKADLVCFGESFLQGFDALSWEYEKDKEIAISTKSPLLKRICSLTLKYGVACCFGYFEKENDIIYSSYAVIVKGELIHNYRRITKNWKEYEITDEHYQEGTTVGEFEYKNHKFMIALCGDLWIQHECFKTDHVLIWPIYVNFSIEEWQHEMIEYAKQAHLVANKTFLINSISQNPNAIGNAFYFENGKVKEQLGFNQEGILIVEL